MRRGEGGAAFFWAVRLEVLRRRRSRPEFLTLFGLDYVGGK